jgi:hypothetical protein
MADYDVGVISLTSPPSLAVLTSYRPAVSVRNNGIHEALASGILRIYSAGLQIFSTELYSAVIAPGATGSALAVDYWTPTEGTYLVIADVTCPLDQVETNNHLAPTKIIVSGAAPPPPPTVPYHAAQHEEGAADELIVDGLHGRLADAQTPLGHKTAHQAGGSDALDVTGLPGILQDGQPIADHHESHEDHGDDELNVEGLAGVLFNKQKPQTHDNSAHDPNFSAKPHGNADHSPHFARQLVDPRQQAQWRLMPHNSEHIIDSMPIPAGTINGHDCLEIFLAGTYTNNSETGPHTLDLSVFLRTADATLCIFSWATPSPEDAGLFEVYGKAFLDYSLTNMIRAGFVIKGNQADLHPQMNSLIMSPAPFDPASDNTVYLCILANTSNPSDSILVSASAIHIVAGS